MSSYLPFTRTTISRRIDSKSSLAALNSLPLITSGAPEDHDFSPQVQRLDRLLDRQSADCLHRNIDRIENRSEVI